MYARLNAFLLIILLFLFSCSQTCHETPIEVPQEALQQSVDRVSDARVFEITDWWLPKEWWKLFHNEQLNAFVEKALGNNPSLQIAEAKIRRAFFVAKSVSSARLPSVDFELDWNRERLSKNGLAGVGATAFPVVNGLFIPLSFNLTQANFNFNYELDWWQKNRNALKAALDEMQSDIWESCLANLVLSVSVAETYYRYQIVHARKEIASAQLENRKKNYTLMEQKVLKGLDTELSLLQARTLMEKVQEVLTELQGTQLVVKYQMQAYLADQFEEEILPIGMDKKKFPRFPLPSSIPIDLLAHRPDIMAQIWRVEAAAKRIHVARANFFPKIDLLGYLGYQTLFFEKLFNWSSIFGLGGVSTHLPIFEGGRLTADLGASEEDYNLAVLNYNDMVINAVKEVLSAVALLENYNQQLQEAEKVRVYTAEFSYLTQERVRHHLDSEINFLNAEYEALNAEDQEIIALGKSLEAALNLVKALGGGEGVFSL